MRLPAASLKRYQIRDTVVMEETSDGILLRPARRTIPKLSWEETARQMAASGEDWRAWDRVVADGLDDVPWHELTTGQVEESRARYRARRRSRTPR